MKMKWLAILLSLMAIGLEFEEVTGQRLGVKFMCDMCESSWLHCLMKCHMEQYMTRHSYDSNQVYVGRPRFKPRKNKLDLMFEHFMHKTGHDNV